MTRACIALLLGYASLVPAGHAQEANEVSDWRSVASVAKWVLAGATIALGVYAYTEHEAAERAHGNLRERCETSPDACAVVDGVYSDAESEALHQTAVSHDRRARTGIVAGQVTLLGGVALFLYDLRDDGGPDNIPYPSPQRTVLRKRTLILGARVPF
jgi:hypothetical protein